MLSGSLCTPAANHGSVSLTRLHRCNAAHMQHQRGTARAPAAWCLQAGRVWQCWCKAARVQPKRCDTHLRRGACGQADRRELRRALLEVEGLVGHLAQDLCAVRCVCCVCMFCMWLVGWVGVAPEQGCCSGDLGMPSKPWQVQHTSINGLNCTKCMLQFPPGRGRGPQPAASPRARCGRPA